MFIDWLGVFLTLVTFSLIFVVISTQKEKHEFNRGYCPNCKAPLRRFDKDPQTGRCYSCTICEYTVWVTWPWVDKDK